MDDAAQVLLLIVSGVLSVFLILAIIALFYVISLLKQIKTVVRHAENVAVNVEAAAQAFERNAAPVAAIKVITNIISQLTKAKGRKR